MNQLDFHVDTARRMQFKNGWNATAIEMARSHRIESKCAWTSVPNWIENRQTRYEAFTDYSEQDTHISDN